MKFTFPDDEGSRKEIAPVRLRMPKEYYAKCHGKTRHRYDGAARAAIKGMIEKHPDLPSPETLRAYKCPFCFGWHVGNRTTPETPR